MTDVQQQGAEGAGPEAEDALTGSGAPPEEVAAADEAVDEEATEVEEHPEPVSHGLVRQDNVSEPGVQTTAAPGHDDDGELGMVKSSHGEPLADDEPDEVAAADVEE